MTEFDYRVAEIRWDINSGFGNHRIVVEAPQAEYVRVKLPWRRRDKFPENIGIRIRYGETVTDVITPKGRYGEPMGGGIYGLGRHEITDIIIEHADRNYGVIVFRAPEAGLYEVYYMPFTMPGGWYDPDVTYFTPDDMNPDIEWSGKSSDSEIKEGCALYYEARTEFDSFYPMEIPMTASETADFFDSCSPFAVVTESRLRAVRMKYELPFIWNGRKSDRLTLTDDVHKNEHYTFQLALCARTNLEDICVRFTDGSGRELSPDECICFNLDGVDTDGREYKIKRNAASGEILPLWCGLKAELFDKDSITVKATVSAKNTVYSETAEINLTVDPTELPHNGEDDIWRMSRLFWLNSKVGISDKAIAPYTPVECDGNKISVLGREFTAGELGLPAEIFSYFDDACLLTEEKYSLLRAPIGLSVTEGGESVSARQLSRETLRHGEIGLEIQSAATAGGLKLDSSVTYECDGHIDCMINITAEKAGDYSFELKLPLRAEAVPYMMGMCREGGAMPRFYEYRWDDRDIGETVWVGGARVGIQLRLMPEYEGWGHPDVLPKLWSNGKTGTLRLTSSPADGIADITASTGKYHFDAGQTETLHFHMIVTPFHEIDYRSHWTEHYYHTNSWHSDEPIPSLDNAIKNGAKTVILHQGGPLNENINYPFIKEASLKEEIDRAHARGLKYKIYYTVRELSNYAYELWALRALGDEIFYMGHNFHIADFFTKEKASADDKPSGGPWLIEHLTEGFQRAWHQFLQNGEYDCAVATTPKSRWHNYYLAGLNRLCRLDGVDGLYLDGIGYDRHITRRVVRIITDAAGTCDIDIHNGNEHRREYGNGVSNCIYMEHIAYAKSIWNGEGFDYQNKSPDYFFTEISGLPLGIMGEMLEGGGNPYRGMIYGQTTRCGWSQGGVSRPIWDVWDSFGIKDSKMLGYWHRDCPVFTENDDVKATVYLKENGEALIALASWSPTCGEWGTNFSLSYNRAALKMDGDGYELYSPYIEGVQEESVFAIDEPIHMDFARGRILILKKKSKTV